METRALVARVELGTSRPTWEGKNDESGHPRAGAHPNLRRLPSLNGDSLVFKKCGIKENKSFVRHTRSVRPEANTLRFPTREM